MTEGSSAAVVATQQQKQQQQQPEPISCTKQASAVDLGDPRVDPEQWRKRLIEISGIEKIRPHVNASATGNNHYTVHPYQVRDGQAGQGRGGGVAPRPSLKCQAASEPWRIVAGPWGRCPCAPAPAQARVPVPPINTPALRLPSVPHPPLL